METVTATEASRSFSALLDEVKRGTVIEIVRAGEHVATMVPPHRANGAAIIDAYTAHRPDPDIADAWHQAHEYANIPEEITDPWAED